MAPNRGSRFPVTIWSLGNDHDEDSDDATDERLCSSTTDATSAAAPARDAVSQWVQHPSSDARSVPAEDQEGQERPEGLDRSCPCGAGRQGSPFESKGKLDQGDDPDLALKQDFVHLARFEIRVRNPALESSAGQGFSSLRLLVASEGVHLGLELDSADAAKPQDQDQDRQVVDEREYEEHARDAL